MCGNCDEDSEAHCKCPVYHTKNILTCPLDLYKRLKLPILDGMAEALQKANEIRAKNLDQKQTDESRKKRSSWKQQRVEEGELRKRWSRSQRIQHTECSDEEDEEDEEPVGGRPEARSASATHNPGRPKKVAVPTATTSGTCRIRDMCKCGQTDHKNTSHRNCPLNKRRQEALTDPENVSRPQKKGRQVPLSAPSSSSDSSSDNGSSDGTSSDESFSEELVCICGSNRTSHKRVCPLNPRYRAV